MNKKLINDETTIGIVKAMVEDKKTQRQIANYLEVSQNTVSRFCKDNEIIPAFHTNKNAIISKEKLLNVYNNPELSICEKAATLGVSSNQMYNNLAYNNIQLLSDKSEDYYLKNDIPETDDDIINVLRSKRISYAKKCSLLNVKLTTLYNLYDKYYLKRPETLEILMKDYNIANNIIDENNIIDDIIKQKIDAPETIKDTEICTPKVENETSSDKQHSVSDINNAREVEQDSIKSESNNITVNLTLNFNINQASFNIGDIIKQAVNSAIEQALKK